MERDTGRIVSSFFLPLISFHLFVITLLCKSRVFDGLVETGVEVRPERKIVWRQDTQEPVQAQTSCRLFFFFLSLCSPALPTFKMRDGDNGERQPRKDIGSRDDGYFSPASPSPRPSGCHKLLSGDFVQLTTCCLGGISRHLSSPKAFWRGPLRSFSGYHDVGVQRAVG